MRAILSCCGLAVMFYAVVWKSHAETQEEKEERYATATRWHLYPEANATYYISSHFNNASWFISEIEEAAKKITDDGCVTLTRTYYPMADIYIRRRSPSHKVVRNEQYCGHGSGDWPTTTYFRSPLPDRWDVMRTFLMCLAPFRFEFQRRDRDEYVNINWGNIKAGYEEDFVKHKDYPPNIPNFPKYTHGVLVDQYLDYAAKSNGKTIIPKYKEDLERYNSWHYYVDLKRLKLYYRMLKFPKPYTTWYYYSSYTMEPKDGCK